VKTLTSMVILKAFRKLAVTCLALFCLGAMFSTKAAPPAGYYQVWGDEFNGTSLDTTKWDYWLPGTRRDAVNIANAVSVSGGYLNITTYTSNSVNYTAMIATDGTFRPRFGYWETSVAWGDTNGMWSAMWMQSPTMGTYLYDPFVSGSEIDVAEHRSTDGTSNGDIINVVQPNVHWNGYGGSAASSGGNNYGSGLGSGFHTYGFQWTPANYTIFIDGSNVRNWNYAQNAVPVSLSTEWMILSSEVQNNLWSGAIPTGGYGSLATSTTKLTVDYVRYYAPTNDIFWTGNSSADMTAAANYVTNMPPLATSDVIFSQLSGNLGPTLGSGLSLDGLVFTWMNNGVTLGGANTLTLGAGGIDMLSANHSVALNCPLNIGAAQTWNIGPNSPGNTLTASGNISGSATLSKGSYGTLVLNGVNSFTGTLNAGTGSGSANDGILQLASSGAAANAAAININDNNGGGSTLQLTGGITVPPPVSLSGRSTNVVGIENVSGSNTLAGALSINVGGAYYLLQSDAGTLNFGGGMSSAATGTRTFTFMGAGNFLVSGTLANGSATVNASQTGAGTLTLSGANTFTGTNRVITGAEILANSAALQSCFTELNPADIGSLYFGTLTAATLGALDGTRDLWLTNASAAAVALTVGNNNQSVAYDGVLRGAGSLAKTGSGTFTLDSANVYSGATTINQGTLQLRPAAMFHLTFDNAAGSSSGSVVTNTGTAGAAMNGVIVGSGATIVSGGRYGNALSINGTGGTAATNIVLVSSKVLNTDAAGNWTVAYWIKTTTAGAVIMYQGDGTWSSSGQTAYFLNANSGSTVGTAAGAVRWAGGFLTGTAALNDGAWHFITLVDNAGTESVYVDGNVDAVTSTMGLPLASDANQIWIGGSPDTDASAVKMNGLIDEVWMFNRPLGQSEVQSLMNNDSVPSFSILPAATPVVVVPGATLDLGGDSQTVASLANAGAVGNSSSTPATLTLSNSSGTTTFGGSLGDASSANAVSLVKNGASTQIFSGVNTYHGSTTINQGTVKLQPSPLFHLAFDNAPGSSAGSVITNTGSAGAALNGVIVGSGATIVSGGRYGNALNLNGTGGAAATNMVLIPGDVLATDAGGNWTVAYWIKTTTAGAVILYQGDGGWNSGDTTFYLNTGSGSAGGTQAGAVRWGGGWLTGTASLTDGNWHFITLVDSAGTESIYVDGNADAVTSTMANPLAVGANQIWIGSSPDGGDGTAKMNGLIDEVWMFNGPLTASQVQTLMNSNAVASFNVLPATTPVSVAAGATLDLGGDSQTVASLAGGGSVTNTGSAAVVTISKSTGTTTFSGSLGDGSAGNALSLVKNGASTEILSGVNTYHGTTTIAAGTLTLGSGGLLPNTSQILLGAGGTLNVSASGLTLGAAQTLSGSGTVLGNLIVNGTLVPGGGLTILTANNNVTLGGTTMMEISKTPQTNDQLVVAGTLTLGGTLVVTNLVGTIAAGDSFKLFPAGSISGSFSSNSLPALGSGLVWNAANLTSGILSVVQTAPTNLVWVVSGTNLNLSWPADHTGWTLLSQTNNLSKGVSANTNDWMRLTSSATTNQIVIPTSPASLGGYYRLVYP